MRWNALINGPDGRRPESRARASFPTPPATSNTRAAPAMVALLLLLTGCAAGGGIAERIGQGMQAVGLGATEAAPQDAERTRLLNLHAAGNLNGGSPSQPLALVVSVYVLRERQRFEATSFESFLDEADLRAALGNDLVTAQELLLLPNQRYEHVQRMDPDAGYLGVVALFRNPAGARWRFVLDADAIGPEGALVGLHACAMTTTSDALLTRLGSPAHTLSAAGCPD